MEIVSTRSVCGDIGRRNSQFVAFVTSKLWVADSTLLSSNVAQRDDDYFLTLSSVKHRAMTSSVKMTSSGNTSFDGVRVMAKKKLFKKAES